MSQDEGTERWWILGISLLAVLLLIPILSRVKRSRGRNVLHHGIFIISASALLLLLPDTIQDICFSQAGVLIVGSIIPVYQSIVAVCTFGESDDIEWLQYWIVSSSFSYGTEFLDTVADHVPFVAEHWYEIEFFVTLWFVLPWTDGSCLLYDQLELQARSRGNVLVDLLVLFLDPFHYYGLSGRHLLVRSLFYSICLCATVYLFLPMFRGAESVFRNVLVPLTGQYENMLLRDALLVRREMERCVKKGRIRDLRAKVAEMFLMETKEE
ncbi:hypothetical protein MHU86_7220 [Fragilaria crotonensis]|nr:hypothetical protein MHU86_7220 [Fragilaria crotonensis]